MHIRLLALLGCCLASYHACAQQTDINQTGAAAQNNLNTLTTGAPTLVPRGTSDGLKGSPYVDDRWRMAQITLSNRLPLAPVALKYDALDQRLLMHKPAPSADSLQLDDRLVQQFVLLAPAPNGPALAARTFRRFAEAPKPTERADYVEVLHQGQYSLLKRHRRTLKKAQLQGAYSDSNRYDEIEDHSDYFLKLPDGQVQPLKLGVKNLQKAAPALDAALKSATAAQSPRTDEDWGRVLDQADPPAAK